MSNLVDVVSGYLSPTGPALVTAVIIATVAGILIVTGTAARIVTYLQEISE